MLNKKNVNTKAFKHKIINFSFLSKYYIQKRTASHIMMLKVIKEEIYSTIALLFCRCSTSGN